MTQLAKRDDSKAMVAQYERLAMEQVAMATAWANQLLAIVEDRKLYATIEGKKYLQFEAWQTIASFDNAHFETDWVRPMLDNNNEPIGYESRVLIVKHGERIGAGEMSCGFDEFPCRGKEGMAKHKAARSAAQTWAGSKAARMNYSYVAVLAGFQPTPAEEMMGSPANAVATERFTCPIHNTTWFKRGKMKEYAHPIDGAKGPRGGTVWCNMEEVQATQQPQETPQEPADVASEPEQVAQEGEGPQAASFEQRKRAMIDWCVEKFDLDYENLIAQAAGYATIDDIKEGMDLRHIAAQVEALHNN